MNNMHWKKIAALTMFTAMTAAPFCDAATITGTAKLEGEVPRARRIRLDADPKCAEMHTDAPLLSEEIVANDQGMLANVFVYVKTGLEGKEFERPSTPVEINQKGCQYFPRVQGMQARQMLLIKNSDPTTHNVHAVPTQNKEFNRGQPEGADPIRTTFQTPEVMIPIKCDVHPWMITYLAVLPHPFHTTSSKDGTFTIKDLPAGEYEIEAWHEKLGTQSQKVKIADGESKEITFTFKQP